MTAVANIYRLGVKELWSLWRDPTMLVLVLYAFTANIYVAATAVPEILHKVPIAIIDEDHSPLSERITSAFYAPNFLPPQELSWQQLDAGLDAGQFTLGLIIPPQFERDVLHHHTPTIQLNVDATRMSQAFSSNSAAQQIVMEEVSEFVGRHRDTSSAPVDIALRTRFNPTLEQTWFASVMEIVNTVTMLSIVLTGAALIREREHGTIEHLLVMPVTPTEIMIAKVWSMGLVVLLATALSLALIVRGALGVPIAGSAAVFLTSAALDLFATTSMGIFMATMARSMPQFGLLLMLTLLPLDMLSGGVTPRESMPEPVQLVMTLAPTTHFVAAAQAVLYRGAGLDVIWPRLAVMLCIGGVFFTIAHTRFRKTLSQMA